MKRREAMEAKDEGRETRTLYAWDYLIGVQDQTWQGALRFKYPGPGVFLTSYDLSAPPVTQLAESVGATKCIEVINELSTTPMVKNTYKTN